MTTGSARSQARIGAGRTVLLIDSDPEGLETGASCLEHLGFDVVAGSSSTDARRLALEHHGALHLVVYDARTRGLDVDAALSLLGQVTSACLLVTGAGRLSPDCVRRIRVNRNAHGFVEKPYTADQLLGVLERSAHRRESPDDMRSDPGDRPFGIAHIC